MLVGNSRALCSICGEGYHYACETISTYFKTSGTWKCPRCKILQSGRGRSRGRGVLEAEDEAEDEAEEDTSKKTYLLNFENKIFFYET